MSIDRNHAKIAARLHGYWLFLRFLRHTPSWTFEQRRAYTTRKLRNALVGAYEGVPFYRARFLDAGFDARVDFKSPADLRHLPVLTKEEVRSNFRDLIDLRHRRLAVSTATSGTTGEPLRMLLTPGFMAFDYATIFRYWSQAGYKFRDRSIALRSYVPDSAGDPLWRLAWGQNTLYMSAYHLSPANAEQYVQRVLQFRPKFIRGYPSSLNLLAEYAYPHRHEFTFVKGIFSASETLLPAERSNIERTFGEKLFDWYGMTEPVLTIHETGAHDGLHINWEYGYAELLPSADLPDGAFRLIATGYHNPVMPFIRYDTGDTVRLVEPADYMYYDARPPRVHSIAGRKDEYVVTSDGRRLPSLNFYTAFSRFDEVLKWQLVQSGNGDFVAKIAVRDGAVDRAALLAAVREELTRRLGTDSRLQVEATQSFVTNHDGKTPPIVRRPRAGVVE